MAQKYSPTLPCPRHQKWVSGQQHSPVILYSWKHPVPILQEAGWALGTVRRGGISRPHRDFFYYQHTFIEVHCVYSSTYVTDTVSIVSYVRVFIGQWTLSLPHTTVPFDPPLYNTHNLITRINFPAPHYTLKKREKG